jgi:hypothetical protein
VLAAAVYRPWDVPHLPLTDFGIFLAARGTSHNLISQFAGVTSYYVGEGRLCLLQYVHIVLASALFGTWAPGWHWSYFVLNSAVLVLGRRLFLRMGVSRLASLAVLALWTVMGPTAELWLRPAGEPLALIFFLVALHLTLNYSSAPDWRRRAILVAFCAIGIIYSKELLVVLLPAGWLFSRVQLRDGEWTWAPWSSRDTFLLEVVAAAVVVAMIPVAYVATHASSVSYVSKYTEASNLLPSLLGRIEIVLVPAAPRFHWLAGLASDSAWTILRVLPNAVWVAMIAIGIAGAKRRRLGWPLAVAAVWITLGLIAYLPWPGQGHFYMMPFAFGTMFAAAFVLSSPLSPGSKNRRAALLSLGFILAVAVVEARSTLNQNRLRAALNAGVIDAIASHGGADVLIAAVPEPEPGTGGWADHLRGFGGAQNKLHVTKWQDVSCADGKRELATTSGVVVVSAAGECGEIADGSEVISASVSRRVWPIIWKSLRSEGRMYVATSTPPRNLSKQ